MDTLTCQRSDCFKPARMSLNARSQSGGLWIGRWCGREDHSPRPMFELMGFEVIER